MYYSSHLLICRTPSFLKQWHGPIYNNKTKLEDLPTVQCMPMRRLLRNLGVKHVDIWILDVEGAEESVLQVIFLCLTVNAFVLLVITVL